jgi:hypothetical protein
LAVLLLAHLSLLASLALELAGPGVTLLALGVAPARAPALLAHLPLLLGLLAVLLGLLAVLLGLLAVLRLAVLLRLLAVLLLAVLLLAHLSLLASLALELAGPGVTLLALGVAPARAPALLAHLPLLLGLLAVLLGLLAVLLLAYRSLLALELTGLRVALLVLFRLASAHVPALLLHAVLLDSVLLLLSSTVWVPVAHVLSPSCERRSSSVRSGRVDARASRGSTIPSRIVMDHHRVYDSRTSRVRHRYPEIGRASRTVGCDFDR